MKTATHSTLMDHVHELRGRLAWSMGVFIIGAVVGYIFRTPIINYLQQPLHQSLYYTTPTGAFEFIVQICGLIGLIAALPVIIFHLLRFIEPALPRKLSWRVLGTVVFFSFTLAVAGAAFAYYVSLPAALHFFNSIGSGNVKALISVDTYFKFVFTYLGTFAIVFQLPLLLLLIDHFTPLGPRGMGKWRKWVIVGAFAIALVTPSAPDPLSQVILALPIILLFEVSVALIWMRGKTRRTPQATTPVVSETAPAAPQVVAKPAAAPLRTPVPRPAMPTLRQSLPPTPTPPMTRASAGTIDLRNQQRPPVNVLDLRGTSQS